MRGALCAWCASMIEHDEPGNYCCTCCELRAAGHELVTVERDGKKHVEWQHKPTRQLTLEEVA